MSQDGQGFGAITVGSFEMRFGDRFDWHEHPFHQLAWAARGVLSVSAAGQTWVIPPTRALWIPTDLLHAVEASRPATMTSLYFHPAQCAVRWRKPTVVAVSNLLRELITHLHQYAGTKSARVRAEAVVFDLLEPLTATTIEVLMPRDPRARRVADLLAAKPSDARTLAALGKAAGASARTLARLFVAETKMSFGHWRTRLRLRSSLALLADGMPVSNVASRVGYETPSAFVAAFRRVIGVSPGAYFQDQGD